MAESRRLTVELRGNARSLIASLQNAQGRVNSFANSVVQANTRIAGSFGQTRAATGQMGTVVGTAGRRAARGYTAMGKSATQGSRAMVAGAAAAGAATNSLMRNDLNPITEFIGFTMLGMQAVRMGVTIATALGGTVAAFAKFEDSFAMVEKTTDATVVQYEELANQIREVATVTPLAVTELNEVAAVGGQLGVGVEHLAQFTEVMAKMGVATNVTAEEAALFQARIGAVMGLDFGDDMERLSSTVVDLGNNFAAREDEIFRFTERITAAGNVVGLTTSDVLAFSTAFTAVGVRAERGGTAFQRVLFEMMEQVNTAGDGLQTLASTAGMTAQEFANTFRSDPAEAVVSFIEGLGRAGTDANGIMTSLFGQNIRTTQSFLALAGAGDLARSAIERGSRAWEQNIALNEEAETRFGTFISQLKILKNQIVDVAIDVGERLAPIVTSVVETFVNLGKAFSSLPAPMQNFILTLTAAAAGIALVGGSMAMMVFPMNVLRNTIIPSLQASWLRLTTTQAQYAFMTQRAAIMTAANNLALSGNTAAANALTGSLGRLNAVGFLQGVAHGGKFRGVIESVGLAMRKIGTVAGIAGLALLKIALVFATLYAVWQGGKKLVSEFTRETLDASEAAEQLALSLEEPLGAAETFSDEVGRFGQATDDFITNNEATIDSLTRMNQAAAELNLMTIGLELVNRGMDVEEAEMQVERLANYAGKEIELNLDINDSDFNTRLPGIIDLVDDLNSGLEGLGFFKGGIEDEFRNIGEVIGQVFVRDIEVGQDMLANFIDDLTAGTDTTRDLHAALRDGKPAFEGFFRASGMGAQAAKDAADDVEILNLATQELWDTMEGMDNAELTELVLTQMGEASLTATGGITDLSRAIAEVLPLENEFAQRVNRTAAFLDLKTFSLDRAGAATDILTDLTEENTDAEDAHADAMERSADAASKLAEVLGGAFETSTYDASEALGTFTSALGEVDDDENPIGSVMGDMMSDVEEFIRFTREMQDAGVEDWMIGLFQAGGPEAMSQARERGAEWVEETARGAMEALRERDELTIDPEIAFAEASFDSSDITKALDQALSDVRHELGDAKRFRDLGFTDLEVEAMEGMFEHIPGGARAAIDALMDDPEGLAKLRRELPRLMILAKGDIDDRLDQWPGNFAGKGAAAANSLIKELEGVDEDVPSEVEMTVVAETVEATGDLVSFEELIASIPPDKQTAIETAIQMGDLEELSELLTEVAEDHKVRVATEAEMQALEEVDAKLEMLTLTEWIALVDAHDGDLSAAREALAGLTEQDRQARIDAYAETGAAESKIQTLIRPRTMSVTVQANMARVQQQLSNFGSQRITVGGNNQGGLIPGRGPNKDSVLTALTRGEFVVQRPAVDALGVDTMREINRGVLPRNRGGLVGMNSGGILDDDTISRLATINPGRAHDPFFTSPFREEGLTSSQARTMLEQMDRTLTLMERDEQRQDLESNIKEARKEHGTASKEYKEAIEALNEFELQTRRSDTREFLEGQIARMEEIEELERNMADNRAQFMADRRPVAAQLDILNERIAAETRYTDEWMALVEERDQLANEQLDNLNQMLEEEKRIKDQLLDLEKQHNKNITELRERRIEDEKKAAKQRADALSSFFEPMTRKEQEWGNTIGAVTDNIRQQVDQFKTWADNLASLRDRGLDDETIMQLGLDDPAAAASVAMFTQATDRELRELNSVVTRQMDAVNRQTKSDQEGMYGDLGENLRQIQEDFNKNLNELHESFNEEQRSLREELAAIGTSSALGFTDAITQGLRSGVPAIRAAAGEVQSAMTGVASSGVGVSVSDPSVETAPQGRLLTAPHLDGTSRYWVEIGGKLYRAAGTGQIREALRLWGPSSGTVSDPYARSGGRLVDYFGPGVMDQMQPYKPSGYTSFDSGGILPPGLTLAYNGTRRNEYVAKPMSSQAAGQGMGEAVTVVVENHVDGKMVERTVTKRQIKKDRQIRVRAGA